MTRSGRVVGPYGSYGGGAAGKIGAAPFGSGPTGPPLARFTAAQARIWARAPPVAAAYPPGRKFVPLLADAWVQHECGCGRCRHMVGA